MFKKKSFERVDLKKMDESKINKEIGADNDSEEVEESEEELQEKLQQIQARRRGRPPKEVEEAENKTAKERTIVVKELPTQQIRKVKLDDGTTAKLITIEEALEEILNKLNE